MESIICEENEMPTQPEPAYNWGNRVGVIVAVFMATLSMASVIYTAGGQSKMIEQNANRMDKIENAAKDNATKGDINRLELKVDKLIDREIDRKK